MTPALKFGEEGTLKALAPYFTQPGLLPGIATNAIKGYQQVAGPHSNLQEPKTPLQGLGQQLLPTIRPVTQPSREKSPTHLGGKIDVKRRVDELVKQAYSIQRDPRRSPEEKQRLIEGIKAERQRLLNEWKNTKQIIRSNKGEP
jgi:hypothetical protein